MATNNTIRTLVNSGLGTAQVARMLGTEPSHVNSALKATKVNQDDLLSTTALADRMQAVVERVIGAVTDEDIARASLKDKAISTGIFTDRAIALRQISGAIVDTESAKAQVLTILRELSIRARERNIDTAVDVALSHARTENGGVGESAPDRQGVFESVHVAPAEGVVIEGVFSDGLECVWGC